MAIVVSQVILGILALAHLATVDIQVFLGIVVYLDIVAFRDNRDIADLVFPDTADWDYLDIVAIVAILVLVVLVAILVLVVLVASQVTADPEFLGTAG